MSIRLHACLAAWLFFTLTAAAYSVDRSFYEGKPMSYAQVCDGTYYNRTWVSNHFSTGGGPDYATYRVCDDNGTCSANITLTEEAGNQPMTSWGVPTGSCGCWDKTVKLLRLANGSFQLSSGTWVGDREAPNSTLPGSTSPAFDLCPVVGYCRVRVEGWIGIGSWDAEDWVDFTDYVATCAAPFLIQTHSRNETDSNVSFERKNVPASQGVNCTINATTEYSFANKTCFAANGENCTANFHAETEVSNVTLQYGKAACMMENGTRLQIYAGCMDCSYLSMSGANWTWALGMAEEWKITNALGEWDKVDTSPRFVYAGNRIRGIFFKVVSRWDGLDHPGIYSAYLNFTLPPQCTMPGGLTEFPVYGLDKYAGRTGPILYFVNFQNAAESYISCTTAANITLDLRVSRHPFMPLQVVDERSENITLEVKPPEFTIDNVQAFEDLGGDVDYWATVSYRFIRYPVPLNTTCNMTVGYLNTSTVVYAGSMRIDALSMGSEGGGSPTDPGTFTSFLFDANATVADVKGAEWAVNCEVPV